MNTKRRITAALVACLLLFTCLLSACGKEKEPELYIGIIRALSDKADGNAHETYANMADVAADNSSRILLRMLENIED